MSISNSFCCTTTKSDSVHAARSSSEFRPRFRHRLTPEMAAELSFADEDQVSVTVRDVSSSGVGFLHRHPVRLQPASMRVKSVEGDDLNFPVVMEWCRPCDNGLYMSGASYVRDPESDGDDCLYATLQLGRSHL